jgi:signal transduction histidine kinase
VSALLDASLDPEVTLAQVARLAVPTLADYCLVDMVDHQGGIRRAATEHGDPEKEGILLRDEYHPAGADPGQHPVTQVVRTGKSILVRQFTEAGSETIADDADHRERRRRLGLRSFMIVPLAAHEKVLGAITLAAAESGRSYTPVDLMTAEDLARRAALVIDNATLYAKVQWAVRARDEVLGFVSHDLRNPLSTINLAASLLADPGTTSAAKQQLAVATIGRAAHQMNAMVNDLLDVSSIEAGHFAVSPSSQDVKELVQQAWNSHAPIAAKKKVQLQYEIAPDISTAWMDANQIARVFSNLVGNAIKFTAESGHITIRAEQAGSEIRFSVADTGAGIAAEQLPHVFDRFWQGKSGDRQGAGLGLSIAKGILDAHGGRIWVESTPQVGSTFSFALPQLGLAGS